MTHGEFQDSGSKKMAEERELNSSRQALACPKGKLIGSFRNRLADACGNHDEARNIRWQFRHAIARQFRRRPNSVPGSRFVEVKNSMMHDWMHDWCRETRVTSTVVELPVKSKRRVSGRVKHTID